MMQAYQDGDTRNIGGVPYVREGGQWRPQVAPQASPAAPYVVGTPRPREAPLHTVETPPEIAIDVGHAQAVPYDLRSAAAHASEAEANAATAQASRDRAEQQRSTPQEAQAELLNVIQNAVEARRISREHNIGFNNATGTGSGLGRGYAAVVGGNANADLGAALDTIKSNVAFSRLQRMRQESPTGGAVGNVSDADLRLLASTIASLDPSQSDERFAQSMRGVIDSYARVYRRLGGDPRQLAQILAADPEFAQGRQPTPAMMQTLGAPPNSAPPAPPPSDGPNGGGRTDINGTPLPDHSGETVVFGDQKPPPQPQGGFSPDQATAYDQFMQSHPHASAADIQAVFPHVSNAAEIVRARDAGGGVISGSQSRAVPPAPADISALRGSPEATSNAVMENMGSNNVPLLGALVQADQAIRGPEAANALLHGGQDWVMFGQRDEATAGIESMFNGNYDANIARQRGVDAYDNQHHFADRLGGQIVAGLPEALLPGGIPAQMARGGVQGALYGLGSGEGNLAERAPNAMLGATIGAVVPPVLAGTGAAVRAGGRRAASWLRGTITPEGQDIAQAAVDENVTASRPLVDATARPRMGRLQASVGGGGPVDAGLSATQRDIEGRAGQLAANGNAAEPGVMGQRIQAAANRGHQQAGAAAGRVYDSAAQAAGDAPIHATEAVKVLDQQIADLSANPNTNRALIGYLQTVRGDLVDAAGNPLPKTVAAIRDLRTGLSGEINRRQLGHTNAERLVGQALDAAGADISRDLGAQAPQALKLYNRADRMWRVRAENRRQVVERIIGPADNPISGGDVMARVRSLTAKDTPRLRRLWGMMDPQERLDTAATIAATAGRKSADEAFSPAQFIAWSRTLSPSARSVVFGPEGAQSIGNLNRLSRALIDTRSALNNSKSGVVRNWGSFYRELAAGFVPGGVLGVVSGTGLTGTALSAGAAAATIAGIGVGARRLSARALMNPDVSRWLQVGARLSTPQSIRSHIGRLSAIATRDPAIAQEVLGLRRSLLQGANDNFGSAAAASGADGEPQSGDSQPGGSPR